MNANFAKQVIEMSTNEAKAAGKFGSPEFNELQGLRAAYPNFKIVVKAPKKKATKKAAPKAETKEEKPKRKCVRKSVQK